MKLTEKQARFAHEYVVDLNGKQAAIRAGYSEKTAEQQGNRLLRNAQVQALIQELMALRSKRTEITQDNVLLELAAMTFYDAGEIGQHQIRGPEDVSKLPDHLRRCVVGWSWDKAGNFTLKLADKLGAANLAMRHLGLLNDKLTIQRPRVIRRDLTGRKREGSQE
ncbi:terminase small subunit [Pseudomonas sp. S 311-6]|nr:terminase [Bordetella sp. J329]MCO7642540.1 terminase small subunit [Pseudomonas sp. S 311-6]